ncbi:ABC-type glycerol-3-phosphate transport system permease component [Streptomyces aurantiacus]|jgi:ABC-type glycerol-3-phosphate transport system permease component|uniref:carbohydrate ABC transporter permease n=1 Tax=Streptomyces aurantiacus TaxID=47760 RepID=UPI00278EC7BE|nr:carbohydrate ABC transporter permease [Streptomyces aurantiacus]MDQ0779658.1 ABC-type glycerol-3-phosphate transport system permease component [Streptomyces aurantiacus]
MRIARTESVATHALLVLASVVAVFPLVSIVVSSLDGSSGGLSLSSYSAAWTQGRFGSALLSSALVSVTVVVATVILASLAGYALATMRVPGGRIILGLLLLGLVLPYEVTVLPLYEMLAGWHLIDTYWALILPQIALSVPLGVLWMRSFFASVPQELLEAARIDGTSRFQTLRLVVLPIAGPALTTLGTVLFLFTWNEFLLALILVPDNAAVQTVPLALSFFSGAARSSDPAVTAAAAVLVALPVLLAYTVLQRRLISGLTEGAVK